MCLKDNVSVFRTHKLQRMLIVRFLSVEKQFQKSTEVVIFQLSFHGGVKSNIVVFLSLKNEPRDLELPQIETILI